MCHAQLPVRLWKVVLTSRLTSNTKERIADLQADPTSSFWCTGQTQTQAGQRILDLQKRDISSYSIAQLIQQVQQLWKRSVKGAANVEEALTLLTIAKIRWLLPIRRKQYLDGRHVTTIADLRETLQSWESTECSLFGEDHQPRTPGNQ